MTCQEARTDLALLAGGDLDDRSRVRELRRHAASCPECKSRYQALRSSLKALSGVGAVDVYTSSTWESQSSLWPAVRRELARPRAEVTAATVVQHLRHWLPFGAMTAACVLMLVTLNQFGGPREQPVSPRGLGAHPPIALETGDEPHSESQSPGSQSDRKKTPTGNPTE